MWPLPPVRNRDSRVKFRMTARDVAGWGIALAGSMLLNITLFGLMPGLVQRVPRENPDREIIDHIQVVRIRHPETMPEKKPPEQISEPQPGKMENPARTPATQIRPTGLPAVRPRHDFQLNPELPALPVDLALPPLAQFSMAVPALKEIYLEGELDSPVTPLVKLPPVYPPLARRRGIDGQVKVSFTVTRDGRVADIRILSAEPARIFDSSVISGVSKWTFKPGTVDGVAVDSLVETTIRFELEKL